MAETRIEIFDTRAEAINVLKALEREGVDGSSITVMSSEPLHLALKDAPRTRIAGFAIAGGIVGAAFAIMLTVLTSKKVGLVTGGMPVVSPWAFGVIVFELTALGAILSTLGRMIVEARLLRRTGVEGYDDAVANGKIVIAIEKRD